MAPDFCHHTTGWSIIIIVEKFHVNNDFTILHQYLLLSIIIITTTTGTPNYGGSGVLLLLTMGFGGRGVFLLVGWREVPKKKTPSSLSKTHELTIS